MSDIFADINKSLDRVAAYHAELEKEVYRLRSELNTVRADANRYRAWREGDVIVRRFADGSGWEARHCDMPNFDHRSWHDGQSLDAVIDAALGELQSNEPSPQV
jgi:hypothetical protein